MLSNLKKKYTVTHYLNNEDIQKKNFYDEYPDFNSVFPLIKKYGGYVFENGLFHIFTFSKAYHWTELITKNYFPELKNSLFCFAITWQGCVLAINDKDEAIYLFDPASCEFFALEETSLEEFFDTVFLDNEDEIIYAEDFLNSMKYLKRSILDSEFSIAHKISLFMGGKDEFENLEVINTEVMWELQIQLAEAIDDLPD